MRIVRKFLLLTVTSLLFCVNGWAAISVTSLTSGSSTTDGTSYTTASITPTANRLVIIVVQSRNSSTNPNTPTITGNGLTWVKIAETYSSNLAFRKVSMFRAMGASPSSGTITINLGGQTQTNCMWSVIELSGIDTSGTNGSGAIVQSVTNPDPATSAHPSLTLATLANSSNMALGAFMHYVNEATSPGSGFTEIHDINISESATGFQTEYKLNTTTVDVTNTYSDWHGIAVEIAIASASANYVVSEGRFTGGGGGASSENYEVTESAFESFSNEAMTSASYTLETQVGVGGQGIANLNSVTPGDFTKFFHDESASYTVSATSQDGDTLEYRGLQGTTVKDGPQASGTLSWTLSESDIGKHTISLEAIDPEGTTLKKQEAYVVRRPTK